ncbi:MAG: ATP-binding protein [Oscillospiraceae bacterium]|nr:ATP-binding protein [Oscillospiraceae bacterium]
MVRIITGAKGSGKTKILVDLINEAVKATDGYVVCVDKGLHLRYDIKPSVRLVDTETWKIFSFEAFYGLIAGMLAGNYDITDVFVDGILKVCGADYEGLGAMLAKVEHLTGESVSIVFTISAPLDELPESVAKYDAH